MKNQPLKLFHAIITLAACLIIGSGTAFADNEKQGGYKGGNVEVYSGQHGGKNWGGKGYGGEMHGYHSGWHDGDRGWYGGHHRGYYYDEGPYHYSGCKWIRGHHNYYGEWIPAHKACWRK